MESISAFSQALGRRGLGSCLHSPHILICQMQIRGLPLGAGERIKGNNAVINLDNVK